MRANLPPPAPQPQPNPQRPVPPAPPGASRRGKWWLVRAGVLLLFAAGAGAGVWWWTQEKPPEPPVPAGVTDPEVAEALEMARAPVLADPRSADAWGNYGTVLLAHLFDRDADQCFVEAARLNPKDPRWPFARGQIALKRDPPSALALLTAAAEAARDRPEYRMPFTLTLAEALLEAGQTDRAAELFEGELARSPGEERALFGMGLVALARGDDAAAARHFEAVRTNPSCRKQANAQLALLARARGDVAAARQFEAEAAALEADPPWPDPYLDRVVALQVGYRGQQRKVAMLERDGNFAAAAAAFLAQVRHKRTSQALSGAAVNFARLKRYDEALALSREAVQLDPADSKAHYTLAIVVFNKAERQWVDDPKSAEAAGGFREAAAEAKRATELKPDHGQAYTIWGLALKNLGEPKAAVEPFRKALSIRPEDFLTHLSLGQALAATGDRAGAEASLTTAKQLRPDDPRPDQELAKLKGR